MNMIEFVRCSKNDVQVCSMFDKMVFETSIGTMYFKALYKSTIVVVFEF